MLIYILFRVFSPIVINAILSSKALAWFFVIFVVFATPLGYYVLGVHPRHNGPRNANRPSLLAAIGRGIRGIYYFFYRRLTAMWGNGLVAGLLAGVASFALTAIIVVIIWKEVQMNWGRRVISATSSFNNTFWNLLALSLMEIYNNKFRLYKHHIHSLHQVSLLKLYLMHIDLCHYTFE